METDCKSTSNKKNEIACNVNPNYNWKDITCEFYDSIKGNTQKCKQY